MSFVVSCTGQAGGSMPVERQRSHLQFEADPTLPEGAILLSTGARVVTAGGGNDDSPGLVGEAISPDGATVVATTEMRLPTGISYNPNLVLIDMRTRRETVIARSRSKEEFNGPIRWSPDGTRIVYEFVRYRRDPHVVFPGAHELETVCTIAIATTPPTCFPNLGNVFDFDWSPDGGSLAVTGPGPQPLQLVDVSTGRRVTLIRLDDPRLRRLLGGRVMQLNSPAWSPTGRYLAAWAEVVPGGSIPVIFGRSGRIVARGRAAILDPRRLMWFPGRDLLVYSPGVTNEHAASLSLYGIDPTSREERLFFRQKVRPQITDFALSPSGGWLALLKWRSDQDVVIEILDVSSGEEINEIPLHAADSLVEWGEAPSQLALSP